MPLYEYECEVCGHRFEVIQQRFSDPPIDRCPKCGGAVRKLQSAPAIQFKGTGWYITDYARKDQDQGSKQDEAQGSSGGDAKEGGSESGKDAAAETKDASKTGTSAPAGESS